MINKLTNKYKFQTNNLYFYFCIFFITLIIFRIILPMGDEPDFLYRAVEYIFHSKTSESVYNVPVNAENFSTAYTCNKHYLRGELFEPLMSIAPYFCNNTIEEFLERISFGLFINIIYFGSIFIVFKNRKLLKYFSLEKEFNHLNMHIFFCSLLYPTLIYYLGTKSNEIFLFYATLLFFFTWRNFILSYILSFFALIIDIGNGVVFFSFISYFYIFRQLSLFFGVKKIIINNIIIFIIIIIFHSVLLELFSNILGSTGIDYFENISTHVLGKTNFIYPNFTKLFITYISFIFLSPGYVKSIILIVLMTLIIFYTFFVLVGFLKNKNYDFFSKDKDFFNDYHINASACITFVVLVVLISPVHAYIRYYLFIYPFIFSLFFLVFNANKIFLISLYAILLLSIETILFRLNFYL